MLPALTLAMGGYLRRPVWVLYSSPIGKQICTRCSSWARKSLLMARPRNAPRWSGTIWNTTKSGKLSPVLDSNGHCGITHTISGCRSLRISSGNTFNKEWDNEAQEKFHGKKFELKVELMRIGI